MNKAIVSKTFSAKKYTDIKLYGKAFGVLEGMTNNVNFPNIQDKVDDLNAKIQRYKTSITNAEQGGKVNTIIKAECRRELETYMQELAEYVQQTSKGNTEMIYTAGFDVHKKPVRVGELEKPERATVKIAHSSGSVWFSCNVVDRALFYIFEYCLAPCTDDSVWIQVTSSRRKILIEGLISGQEYCFRVAAARTHPSRIWSEVVRSYVI